MTIETLIAEAKAAAASNSMGYGSARCGSVLARFVPTSNRGNCQRGQKGRIVWEIDGKPASKEAARKVL